MAVTTQVTHDELIITLTGIDALWALKRKLVVSRSTITSAKVLDRKATIRLLRLRLWGSYLPGAVCAGTFSVSKKAGLPPRSRAFCSMYRAKQVLVITTSNTRPALVMVQVAEPEAIATALSA
jgi:hypothetical protein